MTQTPPNPHAAQARREMMAHMAQVRGEPQPPAAPAEPTAGLMDRVFENWPDMRRYADTARVERLDYCLRGEWRWCWCVTITT